MFSTICFLMVKTLYVSKTCTQPIVKKIPSSSWAVFSTKLLSLSVTIFLKLFLNISTLNVDSTAAPTTPTTMLGFYLIPESVAGVDT